MLTALPKLADRAFILGFYLPALLFAVFSLLLFSNVGHFGQWLDALTAADLGKGAYLLLAIWVVALLTLMFSHTWYQFVEGYTLPRPVRDCLRGRKQLRLRRLLARLTILHERRREEREQFPDAGLNAYIDLQQERAAWWPPKESDVLATDFGNAIKAFETYPRELYGAEGASLWLRLQMVMPKHIVEAVESNRTYIDFLINCCLFSLVFALLAIVRSLCTAPWQQILDFSTFVEKIQYGWLFWCAAGLVAARIFYRCAVRQVPQWGEGVNAAFDCYLPTLAAQFGYELPASANERSVFWTTFSQQIIYRRDPDDLLPFDVDRWQKKLPSPRQSSAESKPPDGDDA